MVIARHGLRHVISKCHTCGIADLSFFEEKFKNIFSTSDFSNAFT